MVSSKVVHEVIAEIARENAYHPILYLFKNLGWPTSLIWDGAPRIDNWLSFYLGVRDSAEVRTVGARWLTSAVACVLTPGCRTSGILVLGGGGGATKIEALRILANDFYADDITAVGLIGAWIVGIDLDEVRSLSEIRALKAFIGRRGDWIGGKDRKRQNVFAATTERSTWPKEIEGSNWWPVQCSTIDLAALERDCPQLWAEALERHAAGEFRQTDRIAVERTSTIRRYLSERCAIHPSYSVEKSALYNDFVHWCEAQGLPADHKVWFARRLRCAYPAQVGNYRADKRPGEQHRRQLYRGLKLKETRIEHRPG